ncbi:MAG TPA: PKD domain-containing protein [Bacteroidales bacterium]|jgi:hypothetical protein|nr:PKD domain-containing protein [Bacteroidales bacterium]
MNTGIKYMTLSGIAFIFSFTITAQQKNFASNVTKSFSLDKAHLNVDYDLISPDTSQLFDVSLKIYYGNRIIQPKAEELTGSWGYKVSPGKKKTILWDLPPELASDIDLITVEVIAAKTVSSTADFEYKIVSQIPSFEVQFENKSVYSDKYSWEFGDQGSLQQNISSLENPVHKYKLPGKYRVGLVSTNTKNNTTDTVIKAVTLVKNDQIARHKNLRTIWASSAAVAAGAGVYGLIRHNSLFNDWKEKGTDDLEKKYKTYRIVGPAGLVVSGICISQVLAQSGKIREAEKKLSLNLLPSGSGFVAGATITF